MRSRSVRRVEARYCSSVDVGEKKTSSPSIGESRGKRQVLVDRPPSPCLSPMGRGMSIKPTVAFVSPTCTQATSLHVAAVFQILNELIR
jgi:hypothetical protein